MHIFVPYDGSARAQSATIEACHMAPPGDTVFVMSAIPVPEHYATACGVSVVPLSALSKQHEGMCSTVLFAPSLRGIHLSFYGA